ncbi:hypothetical protein OH807_02860 [Kitasatospora sp. NBC_01560]|uniref:hypothetical protein n=1 Tax=Kitasatospora sp. NBC_01560 TaxID=2975965 RepID=UPI00386B2518
MSTPDDDSTRDEQVRERSAEERSIVAPTPADVRAKADDDTEDDGRDDEDDEGDAEEPEPPAADTVAP